MTQITPEEKIELLKLLLERGIELRTRYKSRRVVAVERIPGSSSYILIKYEDGSIDEITMQHFAARRFVAVI